MEPAVAAGLAMLGVLVASRISAGGQTTSQTTLFIGLLHGLIDAMGAAAIIVVYQTIRIFNFAQLSLGLFGGAVAFNSLYLLPGVPFVAALAVGIALGAVFGLIFQLFFGIRFARSPRLVLTLASVFAGVYLSQALLPLAQQIPGFPPAAQRPADVISGGRDLTPYLPFGGYTFHLDTPYKFGFAAWFILGFVPVSLLALFAFLRLSRVGRAIRATAENSERAALLGISVTAVGFIAWAIAGAFSSAGIMLRGFIDTPRSAYGFGPDLLLVPLAAALLGGMRRTSTALLACITFDVFHEALARQQSTYAPLIEVLVFVALTAGLLVRARRVVRGDEGTSWQAVREVRPIPREMASLSLVRICRIVGVIAAVVAALLYPWFVSSADQSLGSTTLILGIVVLSLVVLTGWSGQASAGQFALAGVGAIAASQLAVHLGASFWLCLPLATIAGGVVAAALAIPALRVRGLFLLVSTFAFAIVMGTVIFNPTLLPGVVPGALQRPSLPLIDFDDERNMYYLCFVALLVSALVVRNLRRSRFGRLVIAVRENEANARSAGVTAMRTKVAAFAAAGALCGLAGCLFVFQQRGVATSSYDVGTSITVLVAAVIGGPASIGGALLGLVVLTALDRFAPDLPGAQFFVGMVPLIVLYLSPGGLVGAITSARDAVLRIIAERNRMIVPSLFADVDPDALHLRLITLSPPTADPGSGRRARYDISGSRLVTGLQARARDRDDTAALAAAAAAGEKEGEAVLRGTSSIEVLPA